MKILLVEDNEMIIKALLFLLEQHNYKVIVANKLSLASKLISDIDLLILDLMLPDGDGLTFLKEHNDIPTLVLSAKDEEDIVVKAIDLGAEDYIIKPFRSKELLSRINNILKRKRKNNTITYENIKFDMDAYKVYVNEKEVIFTGLELKILFLLLDNRNRIVTRDTIIEKIWDLSGKYVDDNTLSVYVKRTREKLNSESLIKTIKGIGYRVDL